MSAHALARSCTFLCLAVLLLAESPAFQEKLVVRVDGGQVRGEQVEVDGTAVLVFRGVPFAAPPVGSFRWRPPQPVVPWQGVRDARRFAPACPQAPGIVYGVPFTEQSEDCLYLNIWTPVGQAAGKRPVMVWIHGGGNIIGGAGSPVYDGGRLAAAGVVLVSIQYRLGPLGFLSHPALTAEAQALDGRLASGNYGLMDQIAALKWVQANIARVGGDADRVTIFGESAGAADVTALMTSRLARGLFHRAIAESGYFGENVPFLSSRAGASRSGHEIGLEFAARLGVTGEDRQALVSLRALPLEKLLSVPMTIGGLGLASSGAFKFGPIIDGYVLPAGPRELWETGRMHKVPFIAGSNLDDGSVFARAQPIRNLMGYRLAMVALFGPDADEAMKILPAQTAEDVPAAVQRVMTIVAFRAPVRRLVRWVGAVEGHAWLYLFSRNPRRGRAATDGVIHGLEIPYVFGTLNGLGPRGAFADTTDENLSREMMRRWVDFARDGDPNKRRGEGAQSGTTWPVYQATEDRYLEFGDTVTVGQHLDRDACDLADRAVQRRAVRVPGSGNER